MSDTSCGEVGWTGNHVDEGGTGNTKLKVCFWIYVDG